MRRRDLLSLLGGAAVSWPVGAWAQQADRVGHLAVLMGLAEHDPETKVRIAKLRREFERLGWSEGRNLRIDIRFAPAGAQVQALAKELVALRPGLNGRL
jgi:putative ABC transport system substrate-binding protein